MEVQVEYSIPPGCDVSFRVTKIGRVFVPLDNEFSKSKEIFTTGGDPVWPDELLEFAQIEAEFDEERIVKACQRDYWEQSR